MSPEITIRITLDTDAAKAGTPAIEFEGSGLPVPDAHMTGTGLAPMAHGPAQLPTPMDEVASPAPDVSGGALALPMPDGTFAPGGPSAPDESYSTLPSPQEGFV